VGSFKIQLKCKPSVWRANATQVSLTGAGRHSYVAVFAYLCLALTIPLRYGLRHVGMIMIMANCYSDAWNQLVICLHCNTFG
jgi:hypothetical protein